MPNLILPRRFTKQPQYPTQIAPEWRGIFDVCGYFVAGGFYDAVSGILYPGVTKAAAEGVSAGLHSGTNLITIPLPVTYSTTQIISLLSYTRADTRRTNPAYLYASSNSKYCWEHYVDNGAVTFFYDRQSASLAISHSDPPWTRPEFLGCVWDGSNLYGYTGTASASKALTGARVDTPDQLRLSSDTDSNTSDDLYFAAVSRRALSESQILSLRANPWKVFQKRSQVLYFDTAAGGATYTLTAATGSFTVTGNAATLKAARSLTASTGTFTVTGQAAGLRAARKITASTGTFTFTGQAAGLTTARKLTTSTGSFAFTGQTAGLTAARKLTTATGTFVLTGNSATLTYSPVGSYSLTANTGSFALTGQAAGLTASRKIAAALGQFNLTGNAASLLRGFALTGGTGAFVLTGNAATLTYTSQATLTAETGVFTFTGNAATLTYSGLTYAALSAPRSINRNIQAGGRNNTQTNRR